jgi:hypothetical protein
MKSFKQVAVWSISIMASVVIAWNFIKAIFEMHSGVKQFLRLRQIRIQGKSGSTNFSKQTPGSTREGVRAS